MSRRLSFGCHLPGVRAVGLGSLIVVGALLVGVGVVVPAGVAMAASAVFTVNVADDADDGSCDASHCSLREAVNAANASAGADTIAFALTGTTTISPTASLPTVTDPVVIEGTTQPGYDTTPVVAIDGTSAGGATVNGLTITGGGSTVRALSIGHFSGAGIRLSGGGGNRVESCHIGMAPDGLTAAPNGAGVYVLSADNVIGGTTFAQGNIISANFTLPPGTSGAGVRLSGSSATGNSVVGNDIGLDIARKGFHGNAVGVLLDDAPGNTIGGPGQSRNYITGSTTYGIHVKGSGASANIITGNTIGGVWGGTGGDNQREDVYIDDAPGTQLIGNTIEINQIGFSAGTTMVTVSGTGAVGTVIQGNGIGGNGGYDGLAVIDAPNTTIGGTGAGEGNSIGSVDGACISVSGASASSVTIEGNSVGQCGTGILVRGNDVTIGPGNTTSKSSTGIGVVGDRNRVVGNQALRSVESSFLNEVLGSGTGIQITGDDNVVGGTLAADRNVVSGTTRYMNGLPAVNIEGDRNTVQGNRIGTNTAGTAAYVWSMMLQVPPYSTITVTGNQGPGIAVTGFDNVIGGAGLWPGGTCTGACNLVAASGLGYPVAAIEVRGGTGNQVQGNALGTDVTGTTAIPNLGWGIRIPNASGTTVADNLVANSGQAGVAVSGPSQRNELTRNRIRDNAGPGIDLEATEMENAVTPNDPGDADTGPNLLQNYPEVTSATASETASTVGGTLDSTPSRVFRVELFATPTCDASGHGEGARYLGSTTVSTDGTGHGTFSGSGLASIPHGWVVTATATDPVGNTSEFSVCFSGVVQENRPPTVQTAATDVTVAEGTEGSTNGAFTDPDVADTLAVSCTSCPLGSLVDHGDGTWTWSGTPADGPASLTIDVTAQDKAGATATDSVTVTVDNVAPTVSTVLVTPTLTRVGNIVTATGGFTDPGQLDAHTGTWNWGDDTTSVAAITESNGTGTASGSHTYARAGIFVVTLTVTDDDSGSGTASFAAIAVVDPAAGTVAGGGWITLAGPSSLPGDRLPGTPAGTRTTFALSAGYRTTRSTNPVGTLQVGAVPVPGRGAGHPRSRPVRAAPLGSRGEPGQRRPTLAGLRRPPGRPGSNQTLTTQSSCP